MKFEFLTTMQNDYTSLLVGIAIGLCAAIISAISLVKSGNFGFKPYAAGLIAFIVFSMTGLGLSYLPHEKFSEDATLAQVEDLGLTVVATGEDIFAPASTEGKYWSGVDDSRYIWSHLLQLREEDGTTQFCKTVLPESENNTTFFIDCVDLSDPHRKYIPLNRALEVTPVP